MAPAKIPSAVYKEPTDQDRLDMKVFGNCYENSNFGVLLTGRVSDLNIDIG